MRVKIKDLKVGDVIIGGICDMQILSFLSSQYQKNGKELRVAKVNTYGKLDHLINYKKYRISQTILGKMETFVNINNNHKNFNTDVNI